MLEETDNGSLTVSYVYGDDLISQNRGSSYYYLYDGQMSTRQLVDNSEAVLNEYTYDAFGIILGQAGVVANNYMYTGEQYDPNAGFYYLRARYYDQGIGRFVTVDPWMGNVSDPITLHKYIYANSNPAKFRDPSGMMSFSSIMTNLAIRSVLVNVRLAALSTIFHSLSDKKINWTGKMEIFTWGPGTSNVAGGKISIKLESEKYKNHKAVGEYMLLLYGFSFAPKELNWVPDYSEASINVETPGLLGANPWILAGNCLFGSASLTISFPPNRYIGPGPRLSITQIYMGLGIAWAQPETWISDWGFDVGADIMGGVSIPMPGKLKTLPM
ncbi:MAG: RHS repeat-associated core domain-containing protein [Pseudomonadota bacterium]